MAGFSEEFPQIADNVLIGLLIIIGVVGLVQLISVWIVYEKAGEPGWACIVPVYNMWVLSEIGGKPGWLGVLMSFSGTIPVAGPLVGIVLSLVISIGVARSFGRGIFFGIGLARIPIVFYPILAFSDART